MIDGLFHAAMEKTVDLSRSGSLSTIARHGAGCSSVARSHWYRPTHGMFR